MNEFEVSIIVSLISSLLGALVGALIGGRESRKAAIEVMELQMKKQADIARDAYLRNLKLESEYNLKTINDLKPRLKGTPPPLKNLLAPIKIVASSIRTEAFDNLIKAGVLSSITSEEQEIFSRANKKLCHLKREINEHYEEWALTFEWQQHDKETKNPQPLSEPKLLWSTIQTNCNRWIYEIEHDLATTLETLKTMK